ncbi:hypothetical protein WME75_27865 [Sorangium sp. So ce1014]|uniref:hypothetical protein n=1 Tax=Sorangium sp. So ce1014 TaxID=3133326 RepID=UPI003F60FFC0
MSIKGLVVHFRRDLDDHEAERMIDALKMFRGVTKVSPVGAGYEDDLNRERVKRDLLDEMRALLGEE